MLLAGEGRLLCFVKEVADATMFLTKLDGVGAARDRHTCNFGVGVPLLEVKVGQDVEAPDRFRHLKIWMDRPAMVWRMVTSRYPRQFCPGLPFLHQKLHHPTYT